MPVSNEPLVRKSQTRKKPNTKASVFYGADEYLQSLKKKFEHDHEIADTMALMPDGGNPHAAKSSNAGKTAMASHVVDDANRSKKTGRLLPTPNLPEPMEPDIAFLFTRLGEKHIFYMWNIMTMIHGIQWSLLIFYALLLRFSPYGWWFNTLLFGIPWIYCAIQNIYIDHDVMHGATFPPYWWQTYITHCFHDFVSLPWTDFVLEHNRHHASTHDLLKQGEFGWDPEEMHYFLQQWTTGPGVILTLPLCALVHFVGLNDTGGLFALEWYFHFPAAGGGGKCDKEFWSKWFPRRLYHQMWLCMVWGTIWMLGTWPIGRPLSEGWRFMLTVNVFSRIGFGLAWMFITNFTHSLWWNHFLATDPHRTWPILHNIMATVLGGKHRWNEMLFHDVHHAFPNKIGTMSQRGRFHGWEQVFNAASRVLERGVWKDNGDAPTQMDEINKKRSMVLKSRKQNKK